ncbi:hypothetical protein QJQ45_028617 [Haematococcus lacustris]|nr:hypothetical protein QJQ45_028617 [Haematococcus lacustris]
MDQQQLQGAQHQLAQDQQQLQDAQHQLSLNQQELQGAQHQLAQDQQQLQDAQRQVALDQQQLQGAQLQGAQLQGAQLDNATTQHAAMAEAIIAAGHTVSVRWWEQAAPQAEAPPLIHAGSAGVVFFFFFFMFGRVTLASDKKEDAECLRLLHARAPHIASAHMTLNVHLLKEYARECLGWKGKRLTQKKPLLRADILEHLRWEQEMEEDQLAELGGSVYRVVLLAYSITLCGTHNDKMWQRVNVAWADLITGAIGGVLEHNSDGLDSVLPLGALIAAFLALCAKLIPKSVMSPPGPRRRAALARENAISAKLVSSGSGRGGSLKCGGNEADDMLQHTCLAEPSCTHALQEPPPPIVPPTSAGACGHVHVPAAQECKRRCGHAPSEQPGLSILGEPAGTASAEIYMHDLGAVEAAAVVPPAGI